MTGGLNYPVKCKTYGKRHHPLIQMCYICDGYFNSGHYDLVVNNPQQLTAVEEEYFKWRETEVARYIYEQPQFDDSRYGMYND